MEADDATRNPEIFLQTLDRNPDGFLSEIRRKTTACFPILQHRGFYFPPAAGWSPSLSREEKVSHAFLFLDFLFLRFRKVEEV